VTITISGKSLSLVDIAAVARGEAVGIGDDKNGLNRVALSREEVDSTIARSARVCGVKILFGTMRDRYINTDQLVGIQRLALWQH
jgi:histidine ammonia-lyase